MDKRDDFDFDIVNVAFLNGVVPRFTSYVVYISKHIHFDQWSSHIDDFNTENKFLIAKLLRLRYSYPNFPKGFSKFYQWHFHFVSKYNVGFKYFFCKVFLNLNFIETWCMNL